MKLTGYELGLLHGEDGLAKQKAMELLVKYGEALGAERLVETNNVCGGVGGATYIIEFAKHVHDFDEVFSEFKLDSPEKIKIPPVEAFTCALINNMDEEYWQIQGVSQEAHDYSLRNECYCSKVGINLVNTCAPYLVGNVPVKGEHCAWMESSAVAYCNSVLGARTNTEGLESTGAASMVGRIPYWGYHLDENRLGTHLVKVETPIQSVRDWGLLGYYAGEIVQEQLPVFAGIKVQPNMTKLKHCGAAAASSGGVEMYHVVGITPEAETLERAFGGKNPQSELKFGKEESLRTYLSLNSATDPNVDFVVLGCPHYSLEQIWEICRMLGNRKTHSNTNLWIFTPRAIKSIADRQGYTSIISKAGGVLMSETCPSLGRIYPQGIKVAATDSAKQAHYFPAISGCKTWFGSVEDCIEAAVTGIWRGKHS